MHLLSLRVNIYDTAESQFAIPSSVIELDFGSKDASLKRTSDLVFNYESFPFAFWITRRSEPRAQPLFDTRALSLPQTPIPPVIANDTSTALDGFPLVFEDQYLQLTSSLPLDANVYGLGEVVASSGFRRDVGTNGGKGAIQTMWTRDIADPVDENMYVQRQKLIECPVLSTDTRLCPSDMASTLSTSNIATTRRRESRSRMASSSSGLPLLLQVERAHPCLTD